MRFANVTIPKNRTIVAASVQFQVDEATTAATSLRIDGQAADSALVFTTATNNISSRPRTTAFVNWSPASGPTVGAAGTAQAKRRRNPHDPLPAAGRDPAVGTDLEPSQIPFSP